MAEQTFRSPGFFEREIDASARETETIGVPAGVVGTAVKGPAFIPVTVGSMTDFINKFGDVDPDRFGPYAVQAFLKNRTAMTYMRVLGAGANSTTTDISNTLVQGTVKNAGFVVSSSLSTWDGVPPYDDAVNPGVGDGAVQFLVATHYVSASSDYSFPIFVDNASYSATGGSTDTVNLVRAVMFMASGSRMQILNCGETWSNTLDDAASAGLNDPNNGGENFALAISSSRGGAYTSQYEAIAGKGVKIVTASLNPSSDSYITNVLNTNPLKFYEHQHLLYLDFAVEDEIATVAQGAGEVCLLSGSMLNTAAPTSSKYSIATLGRFDTRYTTPTSPEVISQPYGGTEYPLFRFEALSDGAWANDKIKVTIANLRASTDKNWPYATFEVQVRRFDDSDQEPQVLETYPQCNLDTTHENFVARRVGDYKAVYNFDADNAAEKRIVVSGRYANISNFVRVVIRDEVYNRDVPQDACPFGFKGVPVMKTSDTLTDDENLALEFNGTTYGNGKARRMWGSGVAALTGSIIPPLPFRFKLTKGEAEDGNFSGKPGSKEIVDRRLNWGVKYSRCPETGSKANAGLDVNASTVANPLIASYAKFQGIAKMDSLITGSAVDVFNNNKFTLARVVLAGTGSTTANLLQYVSASAKEHILEACYIRNGVPDSQTYAIMDPDATNYGRVTYASLIQSSSVKFNRFTGYTAFNIPLYGGFDGVNILDKDMALLNDRASSTDASSGGQIGKASEEFKSATIGLSSNPCGTGRNNNAIAAYRQAAEIMTDPMTTRINLLAIPGIRDAFVTDTAAEKTKAYSMAMYVMDVPAYSESETRLFGDEDRAPIASASLAFPDVRETAEQFESRVFDNNYVATYFPDVFITDSTTQQKVKVPASVAAMSALGYNDAVAYPWFAPAGFNRGGLGLVSNTDVRLTSEDRDELYDARINPIANFSDGSFVIFGQKTCQLAQSALDRVNVRRMLLELKRQVVSVADRILFEPNNTATRARFINQVTPLLATIQSQQGIESFKVIMDDTNNSVEDVENNRLNGRIVVVPTRAIEFIAIDFIITNSGVDFE